MNEHIPPNSKQSEIAVLGAVLQDARKLEDLDLLPDEFYYQVHRDIYSTMLDLMAMGVPVDIVTVAESLEAADKIESTGGIPYLGELTENAVISNIGAYAANVRDMAKARRIIQVGQDMRGATGEKWREAMDVAMRELMALESGSTSHEHAMKDSIRDAVRLVELAQSTSGLVGVDTGLEKLNTILGGFHDSDFIVIGARPAMGKTALLLHLSRSAKVPVGVISAEQPHDQMALRLIASEGRIVSSNLRNADLDRESYGRIAGATTKLSNAPIVINDKPGISITDIIRQARRWKRNNGIKALYIDYLQKIKPFDRKLPKHEQVGEIAIAMKDLARELKIPVISLAQVNRGVDQRTDKRPGMGDLKHSGEIEQEADEIILLYRDEVYNDDSPDKGIAELIIDKNRHGPTGFVKTAWLGEYMAFENLTYNGESYSRPA